MKFQGHSIWIVLGVLMTLSIIGCKNQQRNEEMNLGGFVLKVPSGFVVDKSDSKYNEEQSTMWKQDSLTITFDLWKKGYGISTAKDLYGKCQYIGMRSGVGYIDNDNPTETDHTIFVLGKGFDAASPYTDFRMVIDYPNSPNLLLIEAYVNDKDVFKLNEIIQNNLKTYTYQGILTEDDNLGYFFKNNIGKYDLTENESIKKRISQFAGERIYHLICAHEEKVTPIEQKNYGGNAFYKWTAFDDQASITVLYNVATDHLQILIQGNDGIQFFAEDPNEYSPFKDQRYYN
ncbi:hypothetical protein [uncultured Phocaeicola sp.]|uniref:hypothetical protein n=1 Tax=uncultured Phocaeicola sp. TaxID=990718 RepID=UPI00259A61EE|nr:hypothetical protein [uncultured Phocaeicola sp.]